MNEIDKTIVKKIFKLILNPTDFHELKKNFEEETEKYFTYNGKNFELLGDKFLNEIFSEKKKDFYNAIYKKVYTSSISIKSFSSYYYQLNDILSLPKSEVKNILEIGGGQGILKNMLKCYDYNHTSLDIDNTFMPNIIGDIRNLKIEDNKYDCVCAFQVIEHVESKSTQQIFDELFRVSKKYVFISLPIQINNFEIKFFLNFKDRILNRLSFNFNFKKLFQGYFITDRDEKKELLRKDKTNPHYFEVGTKNFKKEKIIKMLQNSKLKVIKHYHNEFYPYHWFILLKKKV